MRRPLIIAALLGCALMAGMPALALVPPDPDPGPGPSDPGLEPSRFPNGGDHRKPDVDIVERKQALRDREKQKHPPAQKPAAGPRVLDHTTATRPAPCLTC